MLKYMYKATVLSFMTDIPRFPPRHGGVVGEAHGDAPHSAWFLCKSSAPSFQHVHLLFQQTSGAPAAQCVPHERLSEPNE